MAGLVLILDTDCTDYTDFGIKPTRVNTEAAVLDGGDGALSERLLPVG